ncbi:MAG: hypothetical protein AB1352_00800 [Patescibacteria group bacterium]
MFDDIDFLSPQSEKEKPLRRLPVKREIDLSYPAAKRVAPVPWSLKTLLQRLHFPARKKTPSSSVEHPLLKPEKPLVKVKLPPPPPPPLAVRPNPLAVFFHKIFTRHKISLPSSSQVAQGEKQELSAPPPPPTFVAQPTPPPPLPLSQQTASVIQQGAKLSIPIEERRSEFLDVNLLPLRGRQRISFENLVTLFMGLGICVIFVIGGITVWYRYRAAVLERDIHMKLQEISSVERDLGIRTELLKRALLFYERSNAVGALLKKHTHWLKLLAFIEQHTSQELFYDSLQASPDGAVNLKAQAKSYKAVAEQVISFAHVPEIKRIVVSPLEAKDEDKTGHASVLVNFTLLVNPKIIFPSLLP